MSSSPIVLSPIDSWYLGYLGDEVLRVYVRVHPCLMSSPSELRRSTRYLLCVPVALRLGGSYLSARSENISENGILLSTDFLIPEGTSVELIVDFGRVAGPGVSLTSRGKVLRLQPQGAGGFSIAIACDIPFRISRKNPKDFH